ncbi:MAG: phosphoribosyltransferase family protein [Verrucomicrobiota bacterium]|jgi:predicted phosphoribosyltransferase
MKFASREEAGRQLGRHLRRLKLAVDVVLGLPRGGVVVAAQVAALLERPLDVLIVRKIGHPLHREFAVGALAESNVVILDEASIGKNPLVRMQLENVIAEETERLQSYRARFHSAPPPALEGKAVLLVDDGLATGATAEAAVLSARRQGARNVVVAVPVASPTAVERVAGAANDVVALLADPAFGAVGQYYEKFDETTDEQVLALLRAPPRGGSGTS